MVHIFELSLVFRMCFIEIDEICTDINVNVIVMDLQILISD